MGMSEFCALSAASTPLLSKQAILGRGGFGSGLRSLQRSYVMMWLRSLPLSRTTQCPLAASVFNVQSTGCVQVSAAGSYLKRAFATTASAKRKSEDLKLAKDSEEVELSEGRVGKYEAYVRRVGREKKFRIPKITNYKQLHNLTFDDFQKDIEASLLLHPKANAKVSRLMHMLQRGHTKEHYEEGSIFYRALLKRNMVDPSSNMCALLVRLAIRAGEVNDLIGLIDNVRILLPRRTCAALFLYFQRQEPSEENRKTILRILHYIEFVEMAYHPQLAFPTMTCLVHYGEFTAALPFALKALEKHYTDCMRGVIGWVLLANGKVDDAKSVIGDSKDFLKKPHVAACHILLHLLNGEVSHAVDIFNGKDVGFESSTLRSIIQTFTMPTFQAHTQHLSSFVKLVQESNAAVVNETIGPLVKDVVGDEGAETEAAQEQA